MFTSITTTAFIFIFTYFDGLQAFTVQHLIGEADISHSGPVQVDSNRQFVNQHRDKRWGGHFYGGSTDWNNLLVESVPLDEYQKAKVVAEHNRYRSIVPSTNMRMVYWSEELAASAQRHANTCDFRHSRGRRNVGENIWASPYGNYSDAVQRWFQEVYDSRCGCNHAYKHCCGHYVQVVWADTNLIGCGYAKCRDIQGVSGRGHKHVFVCHYNPQGNLFFVTGNGQMYTIPAFKWATGGKQKCGECPSDAPACNNGLCYKPSANDPITTEQAHPPTQPQSTTQQTETEESDVTEASEPAEQQSTSKYVKMNRRELSKKKSLMMKEDNFVTRS
uniref:SCP domain-containing protein n=1 Tax=Rhabditophanes sp. KR3021 TaxID=114890 RepID=A0AC35TFK5_9BILA